MTLETPQLDPVAPPLQFGGGYVMPDMTTPTIGPTNLQDLIGNHPSADIINLLNGAIVRHISRQGQTVVIDPTGGYEPVTVSLSTKLHHVAQDGDRGLIVFYHPGFDPFAHLATEFDRVKYPDGTISQLCAPVISGACTLLAA